MPTPHEIFHLPRGATSGQIKSRYYELVRYHHPDSHHCRCLPEAEAHAQFQSITAAYDFLRGRTSSHLPGATRYGYNPGKSNFDPYLHELARRRRAQQASQGRHHSTGTSAQGLSDDKTFNPDGAKERWILAFGVMALVLGIFPSVVTFPFHLERVDKSAASNLSQAQTDAREVGHERRTEIRKRVEKMKNGKDPDI